MSLSKLSTEVFDALIAASAAGVAAAISTNEITLVAAFSVIGSVFGGLLGAMLANVITGPGLDKMSMMKRWLANWIGGLACGFFGAWKVRDAWAPDYPTEIVACGLAFVGGMFSVVALCLIWPYLKAKYEIKASNKLNLPGGGI